MKRRLLVSLVAALAIASIALVGCASPASPDQGATTPGTTPATTSGTTPAAPADKVYNWTFLHEHPSGTPLFKYCTGFAEDVKAGGIITERNVRSVRPGFGMAPKYLKDILGKRFAKEASKGTPLGWDLIQSP